MENLKQNKMLQVILFAVFAGCYVLSSFITFEGSYALQTLISIVVIAGLAVLVVMGILVDSLAKLKNVGFIALLAYFVISTIVNCGFFAYISDGNKYNAYHIFYGIAGLGALFVLVMAILSFTSDNELFSTLVTIGLLVTGVLLAIAYICNGIACFGYDSTSGGISAFILAAGYCALFAGLGLGYNFSSKKD